MTSSSTQASIFVSYARVDRYAVDALVLVLESGGYEVRLDRNDIAPAELFKVRIDQLILDSDVVVFVLSPDSVRSAVCAWEVERVLAYGKKLVPLVYRAVDVRECPAGIADRHWVGSAEAWSGHELSAPATQSLVEAIDTDLDWERSRTLWMGRAVRWDQANRPAGQLLRAEEIATAEAWAARRRPKVAALSGVLLEFLSASTARERADRDRLRSISGRAFVLPIIEALAGHEPDRALRMLATAMVLADDPDFRLVPQLWVEGAASLLQRPICSVMDPHVTPATDRYDEDASVFAVSPDALKAALLDAAGNVTLFELTNGKAMWSVSPGVEAHELHCTTDTGVIVISTTGQLLRFAESDGAVIAHTQVKGAITKGLSSVVHETGLVLIAAGATLWRYEIATNLLHELEVFTGEIEGFHHCAAIHGGVAIISGEHSWAETYGLGGGANRRYTGADGEDVYLACFSRDGSTLCVDGGLDAIVYARGAAEPRIRVRHAGKESPIGSDLDTVNLSDDGALLLTSSHDGTARVWDTTTGAEIHRLDHVNEAIITAAGFGPGCKSVFTVGTDNTVRWWSLETSEDVFRIDDRHLGPSTRWLNLGIIGAGVSSDGRRIWIQWTRGLAQVWPCTAWERLGLRAPKARNGTGTAVSAVQSLRLPCIAVCDHKGVFSVCDVETGAVTRTCRLGLKFPDSVLALEAQDMVLASAGATTHAVSLSEDRILWRNAHRERVHTLTFVPRTQVIAVGGGAYGSAAGFIDFMDPAGRTMTRASISGWVSAFCWHRVSSSILVGTVDGSLQEWSEDGRRLLRTIDVFEQKIEAIAAPSDGEHFYVGSSSTVWRVADDRKRREKVYTLSSDARAMACDPSDQVLFVEGMRRPTFIDLRRGAALLIGRPSEFDGPDPEEFERCFVTDDWCACIGVTSKRRWLRRPIADILEIPASPARAIAAALERGNHGRRASERLDVLMSEQPDDLLQRVQALDERSASGSR